MQGNVRLSVRRINQQILGLKVLRLTRQAEQVNQTCDDKSKIVDRGNCLNQ